ncbi:MAG: putative transrane protein [Herminiimonas sp.]|nr:putative transrane protein [Herminiimonas sp.]
MMRPLSAMQRGASLVVALVMLLATFMLGVSATRIAVQNEHAARGTRDRQVALESAEAALIDAQIDIEHSPNSALSRSALFSPDHGDGFVDGCGAGINNIALGLCTRPDEAVPAWVSVDFADASSGSARTVAFGRFTGRRMPTGVGTLPAKLPRYLIELLPYQQRGYSAVAGQVGALYRITAMGFGSHEATRVVLQIFYRKVGAA